VHLTPPSAAQRIDLCRRHLQANVALRGEPYGVRVTRRHLAGYLRGLPGAAALRRDLLVRDSLAECLDVLAAAEERLRALPDLAA
jgi:tRNA-dihydrouridine synthase